MRHHLGLFLATTVLVSACQLQLQNVPTAKKDPVAAAKSPKPGASASPSARPSGLPSPSPSVSAAPTEPSSQLKGTVRIDASYLIGQAGGNLIGQAGGNVIAVGGGNVIAVGGGNVIATGGGNVIAVGGGNYNVLQAGTVSLGTILPVKGMVVVPVSMLDDHQVGPAVFTNEKGEYTLSIPESLKGRVRLYAAVPGKDANDPLLANTRLWYNLLGNAGAADSLLIDEDTVKVSQMIRDTFREKFIYFMTLSSQAVDGGTGVDPETINWGSIPVVQQEAIKSIIRRLQAMVTANQITTAEVPKLARRLADIMIARMDLSTIKLNKATSASWTGPDTVAMPLMVELIADIRTRAQEKMVAGLIKADYPTTITPQIDAWNAQETAANEIRKAKGEKTSTLLPPLKHPDYRIERPSDVSEFMVSEFLTAGTPEFERLDYLLDDLVRDNEPKPETVTAYKLKVDAFGKAVAFYFGLELLKIANETDANGVNTLDAIGTKFRADNPR